MARQRHSPVKFGRRPQRVARQKNVKSPRPFIPLSKHKKGEVIQNPSLVRVNLQKALGKKPIATPLIDSDDSDGLVTKRKNAGEVANPIYASGAVAKGDTPGAHPSRKRKSIDDDEDRTSAEKRRRVTQGSGLKRPSKASLRSPLAPLSSGSAAPSFAANIAIYSPPVPASAAISILRPNLNSSIVPAAETSIIGTLKPRKRQPSILQIIETNLDSSRLTPENENEFLPDDESTPLPVSKITAAIATPGSSLRRPNKDNTSSGGLKQPTTASKREENAIDPDTIEAALPSSSLAPSPQLPYKSTPKQRTAKWLEDSVMAPPVSSSPEASPPKLKSTITTPSKGKQGAKPISTKTLQNLMPSQPKRSQRARKQPFNQFDIPEDSQGQVHGSSGDSDQSPFKSQKKASRKTAPARNRRGTSVLSDATNRSKNVHGAASDAIGKGSASQSGGARHLHTISSGRGRADKENTRLPGGISDELQAIREKFAEVDGWDMEFEEVDVQSSQDGYR